MSKKTINFHLNSTQMTEENTPVSPQEPSQWFGAIPVVGSIGQTIINAIQARKNQERTRQANLELAKYSYEKDLEMWQRGNEYNAPQAQMERLKAAKLNPNLVYGSGAVAGQSAGTLPKYQAPNLEYNAPPPVDVPAALGQYQDFQLRQAQIDNVKAQRAKTQVETLISTIESEYRRAWLIGRRSLQRQNISMNVDKQEITKFQGNVALAKNRLVDQFALGELNKLLSEIGLNNARKTYTDTQRDLLTPAFWAKLGIGGLNAVRGMFGKRALDQIKKTTPSIRGGGSMKAGPAPMPKHPGKHASGEEISKYNAAMAAWRKLHGAK